VGALGLLLLGELGDAVPVLGEQELAELEAAVGVGALADEQGAGVLVERNRAVEAGELRGEALRAGAGDQALDGLGEGGDVGRRGAAAATDERDAEFAGEAVLGLGELGGGEVVDGAAVDVLWQAGVGLDADEAGGVAAEVADVLDHEVGAGGAVEADDVDREGLDDDEGGGDVGADEQGAGRLDGDLDEDRDLDAALASSPVGGDRGALDLKDVLAGLDEDAVDAAVDEAADLLLVVGEQVVEGDVAERDEAGGRADRAEHEARALGGGELGGDLLGEGSGGAVEAVGLIAEVEFVEDEASSAEGVGLDAVGTGGKIGGVDLADDVRPGAHQQLVAAVRALEVLGAEVGVLDHRAHRPVAHEHVLLHGPQKRQGAPALVQVKSRVSWRWGRGHT
jgi:hypothetical protein